MYNFVINPFMPGVLSHKCCHGTFEKTDCKFTKYLTSWVLVKCFLSDIFILKYFGRKMSPKIIALGTAGMNGLR